jgi:hypothetical protein
MSFDIIFLIQGKFELQILHKRLSVFFKKFTTKKGIAPRCLGKPLVQGHPSNNPSVGEYSYDTMMEYFCINAHNIILEKKKKAFEFKIHLGSHYFCF